MNWTLGAQANLTVEGHGRRLSIIVLSVDAFTWATIAVEDEARTVDGLTEAFEAVFASHPHAGLPVCRSLTDAMAQAEAYAKHWQKNPHTAAPCDCGPLVP